MISIVSMKTYRGWGEEQLHNSPSLKVFMGIVKKMKMKKEEK